MFTINNQLFYILLTLQIEFHLIFTSNQPDFNIEQYF